MGEASYGEDTRTGSFRNTRGSTTKPRLLKSSSLVPTPRCYTPVLSTGVTGGLRKDASLVLRLPLSTSYAVKP